MSASAIVPIQISSYMIDLLRARTVAFEGSARLIPMTTTVLNVPRITQDPTAAWKAEGASDTASDGAVDSVTLTAKRLSAITKFSEELQRTPTPNWSALCWLIQ